MIHTSSSWTTFGGWVFQVTSEPRECFLCRDDKIGQMRPVGTHSGVPMAVFLCDDCETWRRDHGKDCVKTYERPNQ